MHSLKGAAAMNIVDTIKQSIGSDALAKLGNLVGADPDTTRTAASAAIPALLAGLTHLGSTRDGAQRLNAAVDSADETAPQQVGGLSATSAGSIIDRGREMLSSLLGGNGLSAFASVIGKFTGMGSGTTLGFLGGLAPLLLGGLKRVKSSMGLDAGGLAQMLSSQKQNIAAALPSGLGNLLASVPGLGDMTGGARAAAEPAKGFVSDTGRSVMRAAGHAADSVRPAASGVGNFLKWAVPALVLLALAIWLIPKAFNRPANTNVNVPQPQAVNPKVPTDLPDARTASGAISSTVDALNSQVKQLVTSTTDTLANIKDAASAEAALPKLRTLNTTIDGISTTLASLPEDTRKPIAATIGSSYTRLKEMADKVMAIPGVADKVRPVVEPMLAKLQALSGK
jgi:hypothetical protein